MGAWTAGAGTLLVAAALAAGCTGPQEEPAVGRTAASPRASLPSAGPPSPGPPSPGPLGTAAPGPRTGTSPRASGAPLLVTGPRAAPLDLSASVARRVVGGRQDRVAGRPVLRGPGAKRRVAGGAAALAVLPAHRVDPTVQVVRVGGVDPLRRPSAYPLGRPGGTGGRPAGRVTTVTVVGDLMLGRRVGAASAAAGDPGRPLRPMARRLASADLTVGNLESTLSTAGAPTQGGDSFAASPRVRAALRDAGFDVLGLANNHLGDYGPVALADTVRLLRAGGLLTFGAGRSVREAWAPAVVERGGVRFGFLGFNAIGETPPVGPGTPGAVSVGMPPRTGPLDEPALERFLRAVRRLDRRVDVVVVLPHWGTQYTERPEPVQRLAARRLVRAGADVVIGGHPHWVQGASWVDGALVVHSLGNFVFDMDFMEETRLGLVAELVFWGPRLAGVRLVPYRIGDDFAPRVQPWAAAARTWELFWAFSGLGATPR